ncbi:hypothetical protein GGX14DRAFT_571342 [Mycena pura]|uniref:Uncharacterized protein n=1 Tax=Mycena pura TaxID=153505 RepID=A0AAD6V7F3_9AGAR|nr:hypothetical protein GGX14DRAFT_571342 [Mycena pura]
MVNQRSKLSAGTRVANHNLWVYVGPLFSHTHAEDFQKTTIDLRSWNEDTRELAGIVKVATDTAPETRANAPETRAAAPQSLALVLNTAAGTVQITVWDPPAVPYCYRLLPAARARVRRRQCRAHFPCLRPCPRHPLPVALTRCLHLSSLPVPTSRFCSLFVPAVLATLALGRRHRRRCPVTSMAPLSSSCRMLGEGSVHRILPIDADSI